MDKNVHFHLFNFSFLFLRNGYSKAIKNEWGKIHALKKRKNGWFSQEDIFIFGQEQDLMGSQGVEGAQGPIPALLENSPSSI